MNNEIRPIALTIINKDDCILVAKGYDIFREKYFFRPIGGGIDFNEYSKEAAVREIKEEINLDILIDDFITIIENIYNYNGILTHEIVFIYKGKFKENEEYLKNEFDGVTSNNLQFKAYWIKIEDFKKGIKELHPFGLIHFL
jgi:8-oxo-dGTP pyrophosphatase MutT (NUDIX family)